MKKNKAIEEIKQLKELLDSGIITQDEYDAKSVELKKIILDLDKNKDETSENEIKKQAKVKKEKDENLPNLNTESLSGAKQNLTDKFAEIKQKSKNYPNESIFRNWLNKFRSWLNKKESADKNFLFIALGAILIPTYSFVFMTFQNYMIGLANGSVAYGEYPFEKNVGYLVVWLAIGIPLFLLISFLISLIKSLRIKMVKVFFLFTIFFTLFFIRLIQTTIYPAISITKEYEDNERIKSKLAETFFNEGTKKSTNKNYKGAIKDFTSFIELKPNNPDGYSKRGWAKQKLEDYYGAIADFTKLIELEPNNSYAYTNRGYSRVMSGGSKNGACADLRKAISLGSKNNVDWVAENCD